MQMAHTSPSSKIYIKSHRREVGFQPEDTEAERRMVLTCMFTKKPRYKINIFKYKDILV